MILWDAFWDYVLNFHNGGDISACIQMKYNIKIKIVGQICAIMYILVCASKWLIVVCTSNVCQICITMQIYSVCMMCLGNA
jgi:hypothetical protein